MFSNYIFIITALLIYYAYQPSAVPYFNGLQALGVGLGLLIVFVLLNIIGFKKVKLSEQFNALQNRLFILGIIIYSINIHWLEMDRFLNDPVFFEVFPTLKTMCFLSIFIFYLVIVWLSGYKAYQKIFVSDLPGWEYIRSNLYFLVPALLPWLFLALSSDAMMALPFQNLKDFMNSLLGEIIYFSIFILVVAMLGPALLIKFWGCSPLESGEHRRRIIALCQRAGVSFNNILYWPMFGGTMLTAGVMGLIGRFRYILITTALLDFLDSEEIDAVIAHEIGHIKKKHLWFYLFFFIGFPFFAYLVNVAMLTMFYKPSSYIIMLTTIAAFIIYFRYFFGYTMRNLERQADIYVYTLFNSSKSMITTFQKFIAMSPSEKNKPNWHHFNLLQRMTYLQKCEKDKKWITHHNNKVKKIIISYFGILMILCLGSYQFKYGYTGKYFNNYLFKKAITAEFENIHDAATLNNLAWTLVTYEEFSFRDAGLGLKLVHKALTMHTAPYILDTLAECYFVNQQYAQALKAGKKALALFDIQIKLKPQNQKRSYFEGQIQKFSSKSIIH